VIICGLSLGLHLSQEAGFHQACLMFAQSCKRGITLPSHRWRHRRLPKRRRTACK